MMNPIAHVVLVALALHLVACRPPAREEPSRPTAPSPSTVVPPVVVAPVTLSSKLFRPAPPRLVAIGDLHGDLDHTRRVLRLAGAIDASDRWIGGALVVVQTGDQVDRGDDDKTILDLIETLKTQAVAAGGDFIALLGNHEIMNASLDFRYVTPGSLAAFARLVATDAAASPSTAALADLPPDSRGRAAAFAPGGGYARAMAGRPLMMKVGDSVFVHGGVLPKHVEYGLDRMNDELDDWLMAKRRQPPAVVVAEDGPVWTRVYSIEDGAPDCSTLKTALERLGAKRMVVGHTVQRAGVNSACDGAVWRIDVGLSRYYGGPIELLEIRGDAVGSLREK